MANRKWAGKDKPNLEPKPEDEFTVDIPGYDLRRLMAAEDPLAAANAFFVQIRTVLAQYSAFACVRIVRTAAAQTTLVKMLLAALRKSWEEY